MTISEEKIEPQCNPALLSQVNRKGESWQDRKHLENNHPNLINTMENYI